MRDRSPRPGGCYPLPARRPRHRISEERSCRRWSLRHRVGIVCHSDIKHVMGIPLPDSHLRDPDHLLGVQATDEAVITTPLNDATLRVIAVQRVSSVVARGRTISFYRRDAVIPAQAKGALRNSDTDEDVSAAGSFCHCVLRMFEAQHASENMEDGRRVNSPPIVCSPGLPVPVHWHQLVRRGAFGIQAGRRKIWKFCAQRSFQARSWPLVGVSLPGL